MKDVMSKVTARAKIRPFPPALLQPSSGLGFSPLFGLTVQFSQEADDFFMLESPVTLRGNAVCPDLDAVIPVPHNHLDLPICLLNAR